MIYITTNAVIHKKNVEDTPISPQRTNIHRYSYNSIPREENRNEKMRILNCDKKNKE